MTVDLEALPVYNNETEGQFEIAVGDEVARLEYTRANSTITYTHTVVPATLEGEGIGGKLARHALEFARENNLKVVVRCPFVNSYLQRHPEYQSLLV